MVYARHVGPQTNPVVLTVTGGADLSLTWDNEGSLPFPHIGYCWQQISGDSNTQPS